MSIIKGLTYKLPSGSVVRVYCVDEEIDCFYLKSWRIDSMRGTVHFTPRWLEMYGELL